jgi:transposase-like protein
MDTPKTAKFSIGDVVTLNDVQMVVIDVTYTTKTYEGKEVQLKHPDYTLLDNEGNHWSHIPERHINYEEQKKERLYNLNNLTYTKEAFISFFSVFARDFYNFMKGRVGDKVIEKEGEKALNSLILLARNLLGGLLVPKVMENWLNKLIVATVNNIIAGDTKTEEEIGLTYSMLYRSWIFHNRINKLSQEVLQSEDFDKEVLAYSKKALQQEKADRDFVKTISKTLVVKETKAPTANKGEYGMNKYAVMANISMQWTTSIAKEDLYVTASSDFLAYEMEDIELAPEHKELHIEGGENIGYDRPPIINCDDTTMVKVLVTADDEEEAKAKVKDYLEDVTNWDATIDDGDDAFDLDEVSIEVTIVDVDPIDQQAPPAPKEDEEIPESETEELKEPVREALRVTKKLVPVEIDEAKKKKKPFKKEDKKASPKYCPKCNSEVKWSFKTGGKPGFYCSKCKKTFDKSKLNDKKEEEIKETNRPSQKRPIITSDKNKPVKIQKDSINEARESFINHFKKDK